MFWNYRGYLHSNVNLLNAIELYTFKWFIVGYVTYLSETTMLIEIPNNKVMFRMHC